MSSGPPKVEHVPLAVNSTSSRLGLGRLGTACLSSPVIASADRLADVVKFIVIGGAIVLVVAEAHLDQNRHFVRVRQEIEPADAVVILRARDWSGPEASQIASTDLVGIFAAGTMRCKTPRCRGPGRS